MNKLKKYQKLFNEKGYILEKFNGFYGVGYYFIKKLDYEKGYTDWKYSIDLDITLQLI
jgi:hypothetical protein